MPRYFFHVKDGICLARDKIGKDLANLSIARAEAQTIADDVRSDLGGTPRLVNELRIEIADCTGKVLDAISLDKRPRFH